MSVLYSSFAYVAQNYPKNISPVKKGKAKKVQVTEMWHHCEAK